MAGGMTLPGVVKREESSPAQTPQHLPFQTSINVSAADPAAAPSASAAAQLLEEVERLTRRHQAELGRCFDDWLKRHGNSASPRTSPGELVMGEVVTERSSKRTSIDRGSGEAAATKLAAACGAMPMGHIPSLSVIPVTSMAKEVVSEKRKTRRKKTFQFIAPRTPMQSKPMLQRFIQSRYYEWASGALIILNAVFLGWQTQSAADIAAARAAAGLSPAASDDPTMVAIQWTFTIFFTVELGMRWWSDGLVHFFVHDDMWWNIMDVLIVTMSIIDLLAFVFISSNEDNETVISNVSMLRVIRVVRVIRVARVIRIMKFFRELRMMIFSILGSMKSLLWVMLILAMTFYIFGITFTAATTAALNTPEKWTAPETRILRRTFGTLDKSVLSLFMAMSGGSDWGTYWNALGHLPGFYRFLLLLYITFAVFGVVNVVTGVFMDQAMQSSSNDRDIMVHEELEAKKAYLSSMRDLFDEMDSSGSGVVTLDEFEKQLEDERVIAYFNALKLDATDACTLFRLLDHDQSNEVNIDEFISGCYRLQGESRSLDVKLMQCEVRFLKETFIGMSEMVRRIHVNLLGGCSSQPTATATIASQGLERPTLNVLDTLSCS